MKTIMINDKNYEIVKDYNDAIDLEEITSKMTEYFDEFDYVVGDWSYSKLRLKGFYDDDNKKATNINSIKNLDDYIKNYCSYGCKYFVLNKKD